MEIRSYVFSITYNGPRCWTRRNVDLMVVLDKTSGVSTIQYHPVESLTLIPKFMTIVPVVVYSWADRPPTIGPSASGAKNYEGLKRPISTLKLIGT